ncbi:MIF4G-like type 3 [Trinorchestia longiramus]|nr:MIF4G-like type 3 [Trinorchestia longiramus]
MAVLQTNANHVAVTKSHSVSSFSGKRDVNVKKHSARHHQNSATTITTNSEAKKGPSPAPTRGPTVQRQRSCVANLYGVHLCIIFIKLTYSEYCISNLAPSSSSKRTLLGRSHPGTMPAATAYQRTKPAMQLYRPPTLRVSDDFSTSNGSYCYDAPNGGDLASSFCSFKPGLNINAKEFVSLSSNGVGHNGALGSTPTTSNSSNSVLKHSKSSTHVSSSHHRQNGSALHHSKSSVVIVGSGGKGVAKEGRPSGASPPLRVHFTDEAIIYDPGNKAGMTSTTPTTTTTTHQLLGSAPLVIKRSKSLGSAADLHRPQSSPPGTEDGQGVTDPATNAIKDLAPFADDVLKKLHLVLQRPDESGSRLHMEVMKLLFGKLVQGTRYAEPAARYCIAVIEKESGSETFLDTLLNTCQEFYQERESLLRSVATPTRWLSYMTFLHEMYTQVKRRLRRSTGGPRLLLLTLLAECCVTSLQDLARTGATAPEMECLFFILTGIGRDLEASLPTHMGRIMAGARDALLSAARTPPVRKTLLQLIEMSASSWHLPAPAVMYYHPGLGGGK